MTIIDRGRHFIFLKSRKTASSSIENFLVKETALGDDIYATSKELVDFGLPRSRRQQPLIPWQSRYWYTPSDFDRSVRGRVRGAYRFFPQLSQHDSALKVRRLIGATFFDKALKAVPIRNPWDALVSYFYWDKSGALGQKEPIDVPWVDWLDDRLNFDDSSDGLCAAQRFLFYDHLFLKGDPLKAEYLFFEDIQGSLADLASILGLRFPDFDESGMFLKKTQRDRDYRVYYSSEQAERVQRVFDGFLSLVKYNFDMVGHRPD